MLLTFLFVIFSPITALLVFNWQRNGGIIVRSLCKDRLNFTVLMLPILTIGYWLIADRALTDVLLANLLFVFSYIVAMSDLKSKIIPNSLVLAMLIAWIFATIPRVFLNVDTNIDALLNSLYGAAIAGGLFLLVYVVSRKGLGGGDVKFMAVAGLYLAMSRVLPAMLIASVLAALCGIILMLSKKLSKKDSIPLAPFLFVGIVISQFLG